MNTSTILFVTAFIGFILTIIPPTNSRRRFIKKYGYLTLSAFIIIFLFFHFKK